MNKRSKARWVRNLRDPKYANNQMINNLANDDHTKFCALGVFVDGHSSVKTREKTNRNDKVVYRTWVFSRPAQGLRLGIVDLFKSAGLTYENRVKIVELNDQRKWSLPKIADWIEENL